MNRSVYWNLCEQRLSTLCTRVEIRGKLNVLDFNIHAEDFYLNFLNILFDYSLKNINLIKQNAAGIDLIDDVNNLVLQVSSTATKAKIESSLSKDLSVYKSFTFNFVSISKDASDLRKGSYVNPHGLTFIPKDHIHDVTSILNHIMHLESSKQRVIYEFLKRELQLDVDPPMVETNLATIINILSKETFDVDISSHISKVFNVDKKLIFNNLNTAAMVIEDYKIQHHKIDKIYSVFDQSGKNKSNSVLHWLRETYIKLSSKYESDELFFQVVEETIQTVKNSANYVAIPLEELAMWTNALVVDAFIRCKIFKNPEVTPNAST